MANLTRLMPLVMATAFVCFSPVARGGAGQAAPVAAAPVDGPLFKENARVLFQGDSITDGERNRNDCPHLLLGQGYQFIIAARFSAQYPESKVTFINRAVSGNNVKTMAARWKTAPACCAKSRRAFARRCRGWPSACG